MIELYDESTHICNLEPGKAFRNRGLATGLREPASYLGAAQRSQEKLAG